ncbi:MAG: hypothetical protein ACJA1C_003033 [Crocinitomicaceae bacterium]
MKNKNNIDELFKSKLEERAFDIKPAFLDQLNGQLDAHTAGKGRGFIYFSVGILLVLSIVFVGIIMLSNDEPTNSNQASSISENSDRLKNTKRSVNYKKNNSSRREIPVTSNKSSSLTEGSTIQFGDKPADGINGSGESVSRLGEETSAASSSESVSRLGEETSAASSSESVSRWGEEAGVASSGESGSGSGEEASAVSSGESGSGSGEETGAASSGESVSRLGEEASAVSSGESVSRSGEETGAVSSGESVSRSGEETGAASSGESGSGSGEETGAAGSGVSGSGSGEETGAVSSSESESGSGEETSAASSGVSGAENPDESEKPTQEIETTNSEPPNTKETEDPKLPLKANSPWSLQYSIGGNYITKNSIAGSPESIAIRKAQESNIFTSQVNFAVNYDLNKLRLSTGLSFAQHGENLSYSPVTYDSTFVSSYTFVVDSTSMDTTYFYNYDTTTVTNTAAMEGNKNNRHSYITVPINFGYSFNIINNKFTITPKGGVGIRFLVAGSGNYITDNLTGILEEKDKPVTFSYNGSVEFTYHFGNKSVFLAPTYHSTFSTFKSLHRYSGIGVKFGIVFKL